MKHILLTRRQFSEKSERNENSQKGNFIKRVTKHIHFRLFAFKSIILLVLSFVLGTATMAQNPTDNDLWNNHNLIKNWDFTTDLTDWRDFIDFSVAGQTAPVVTNGYVSMTTSHAIDGASWHYQFMQRGLKAEANVPYTLRFKSWSSTARSNGLDFEDAGSFNLYNRYGSSADPESVNGRSEWVYYTTPESKWFTFHVVFDQMLPSTEQKIQWMLSTANATTYLDSILLFRDDTSSVNLTNLVLSETNLNLAETEAIATVNITSNTDWEISSSQSWLTVTPPNGTGNKTFTVSAKGNPLFAPRTATITVFANMLDPQTITVTQNAREQLPDDQIIVEHWDSVIWNSYNLIKNWDFTTDLTDWGGWIDFSVAGQTAPVVTNGYVSMTTSHAIDGAPWHYQFMQRGLKAEANVPYTLTFKSWSSTSRSNVFDFEDAGPFGLYNRYGASADPESVNGRSEWVYYTTPEPKWFTFHVVFDQMLPSTEQKIQWMLSTANATTYLDSILLFKDDTSSVNLTKLVLSETKLNLAETEAIATVNITSNTDWEISSSQPWLTVTPPNGTGNQTITVSAKGNPLFAPRIATITVFATRLDPQTITVTQNAREQLPVDQIIVEHWDSIAWNGYNLIKNWDFMTDLTDWGGWIDYNVPGQIAPVVTNGSVSMATSHAVDGNCWHYQISQSGLKAEANVSYTLRFKSWSSTNRSNDIDFEDAGPSSPYNRYGVSNDLESVDGRSEWIYYTSPEPKWFTFHVVFDQMLPDTKQKIQWMLSTADGTVYLDSIILIKDADLLLIKDANLVLSSTQVSIAATEANAKVNLTSNTKCMAISDQTWLTIDPANSKGNQTITISAEANPLTENRTATVTVFAAGMESQTITVTQDFATGIDPILNDQKLIIYPNPTSGKVKIVLDQNPQRGTYLIVTDLNGKIVLKQFIQNKEEWIDLTGNPSGVYLITTNLKNEKVQKILLK